MTALKEYERLEALGLWRESESAQLVEVVVSFGSATLVLSDKNDRALTHWSLAAVRTLNPGEVPTMYAPDRDANETLEIDDPLMIEAIGKVRAAIRQSKPHPGRLRWILAGVIVLCLAILALFWMPSIAANYAARVIPLAKQEQIGTELMQHTSRLTGRPCNAKLGRAPLNQMRQWLLPEGYTLHIMDMGAKFSTSLPGGHILINRTLVEEHAGPEVAAGFVLMELALAEEKPPVSDLFDSIGTGATLKFLANGAMDSNQLARFAQNRLISPLGRPEEDRLLVLFAIAELTSSPFAAALDNTLKTTKAYVERDPLKSNYTPPLTDGDWIALQSICGDG